MPRFFTRRIRKISRKSLKNKAINSFSSSIKKLLLPKLGSISLSGFGQQSGQKSQIADFGQFEQSFLSLFENSFSSLIAGGEKFTTTSGESARSQEVQQNFNLSRSQRAALLSESARSGNRNL